jgi:ABC-2 type transport system ATP-binding protein
MTDTLAVESSGLAKRFGRRPAVAGIDLAVPAGSVYGFLGPNGSGKTTTIRMLVGLVRPSAGSHRLLGESMPAASPRVLGRVAALIEGPAFHPYLSGRANLRRLDAADMFGDRSTAASRVDAALDRVGLTAAATKPYRAYSLGMRQRLAIAACLRSPRELVILDEPTNGLDPQGTREIRALVADLHASGATVLVSSHLLSEIEQMCSHLGIMRAGRLVAQGPVASLRADAGPARVVVDTDRPDEAVRVLTALGLGAVAAQPGGAGAALGEVPVASIVPALVAGGVPVLGFAVRRPSLEDLYVGLTGEGFDVRE